MFTTIFIFITDLQQGVSICDAHKAIKSEDEMDDLEGRVEVREGEIDEAMDICKATLYPNMEKSHILVWPMLEPPGYRYGLFDHRQFDNTFTYSFSENATSGQVVFLLFNKEKETVHIAK